MLILSFALLIEWIISLPLKERIDSERLSEIRILPLNKSSIIIDYPEFPKPEYERFDNSVFDRTTLVDDQKIMTTEFTNSSKLDLDVKVKNNSKRENEKNQSNKYKQECNLYQFAYDTQYFTKLNPFTMIGSSIDKGIKDRLYKIEKNFPSKFINKISLNIFLDCSSGIRFANQNVVIDVVITEANKIEIHKNGKIEFYNQIEKLQKHVFVTLEVTYNLLTGMLNVALNSKILIDLQEKKNQIFEPYLIVKCGWSQYTDVKIC